MKSAFERQSCGRQGATAGVAASSGPGSGRRHGCAAASPAQPKSPLAAHHDGEQDHRQRRGRDVTPSQSLAQLLAHSAAEAALGVPQPLRTAWERALHAPLQAFLARPSKDIRGRLVKAVWQVVAGTPDGLPPELPALVEGLHAGSLIVDDIQDGSAERRGGPTMHEMVGTPLALNTGCWLYFWAVSQLGRMSLPPLARLRLHEELGQALLACHQGQALDLAADVVAIPRRAVGDVVRAATLLKTGGLTTFACSAGAIAAGATEQEAAVLRQFGENLGIALQMFDDWSGVALENRAHKGDEDLRLGRATWCWAWLAIISTDETYDAALERLAATMAGDAPTDLRLFLADRIAGFGLEEAQRHIRRSLDMLETGLGSRPYLSMLVSAIESMREHYVR